MTIHFYSEIRKRGFGMGAFKLLGKELSKLAEKKGVLFSLIGVLLIPIVYVAVLFLASIAGFILIFVLRKKRKIC